MDRLHQAFEFVWMMLIQQSCAELNTTLEVDVSQRKYLHLASHVTLYPVSFVTHHC